MERYQIEAKEVSATEVAVNLIVLGEVYETKNGTIGQQMKQVAQATGTGANLKSAYKKAVARAKKKVESFGDNLLRIQIMSSKAKDGKFVVQAELALFDDLPENLKGKGQYPKSKVVQVFGTGKTKESAEDNALKEARKLIGV